MEQSEERLPEETVDMISEKLGKEAYALCRSFVEYALEHGYKVITVSVLKPVEIGRQVIMGGSSNQHLDIEYAPALPIEAKAIRMLADKLDAAFAESQAPAAERSSMREIPWEDAGA